MMGQIFKLFGTIGIDTGDADKAIDKVTNQAKKLSKTMQTVGTALKDTGKKMTTFITVPAITAVTASIKAFADLEQAIGGIETMFKGAADKVIKNSETAYKRAGVSGVSYMEQVTSFSASLLQGLGGDTERAGDLADTAMVDMSDNANKFGTSIESIQDAYQGFAKGNFTMLDNLKLGFGGTAGEMAELINKSGVLGDTVKVTAEDMATMDFHTMIEAIHIIQTEMGITGTTAKEAEETVSGAFGMMKASIMDLAAGFGQAGSDMDTLMSNAFQSVQTFGENIKRVLGNMWDNLPMEEWQKWVTAIVIAAGPILIVLGTLVSGISSVIGTVAKAGSIIGGLGKAFAVLIGPTGIVIAIIAGLIAAFVTMYKTSDEFRAKFQLVIDRVKDFVSNFGSLKEQLMNGAIWETLKGYLQTLVDFWTNLFSGEGNLGETFVRIFNMVKDIALPILHDAINFIKSIVSQLTTFWSENGEQIVTAVKNAFSFVADVIGFFMPIVAGIINTVWGNIKGVIQGALNIIMGLVKIFTGIFTGDWKKLWEGIKQTLKGALEFAWNLWNLIMMKNLLSGIKNFVTNGLATFKNFFTNLGSNTKNMLNMLRQSWSGFVNTVKGIVNGFRTSISSTFTGLWNSIKTIWNGIKLAITNPMNTAMNAIKRIINTIKGLWNFKISWPKIPMPSFGINPSGWKIGDLLKGKIPKLSVNWNAKGGIFNEPTIFETAKGFQGVGEAGSEAIIPLSKEVLGGIGDGIAKASNLNNNNDLEGTEERLSDVIKLLSIIAELIRNGKLVINDREMGRYVRSLV